MPWGTRSLTLYHGTIGPFADVISQTTGPRANGIDLARCGPISDFGPGFYTTRILRQAVAYANERYQEYSDAHTLSLRTIVDPISAAIVEFSINLDAMGSCTNLAFVQPTSDWLDFVRYCRLPSQTHKAGRLYDIVYGPVWAVGSGAIPDWEQISFHNHYPTTLLQPRQVLRGNRRL